MQIGWNHLKDDIALMGADNGFTALVWPLGGEDPDDAFSSVPYEKVMLSYYKNHPTLRLCVLVLH
jgi:leukotriene-A4 hydrolase